MMTNNEINQLAQSALMIVGGYAFCPFENGNIRVVGLKHTPLLESQIHCQYKQE